MLYYTITLTLTITMTMTITTTITRLYYTTTILCGQGQRRVRGWRGRPPGHAGRPSGLAERNAQ